MFEKAQGEKVTLPCTFELSEEDEGPLDIEWVLIPADNQKRELIVSRDFCLHIVNSVVQVGQCMSFVTDFLNFHLFRLGCL